MQNPNLPNSTQRDYLAWRPVRLAKRAVLILFGGFYFLFVAFVPLLCRTRPGFRGWYWRLVKRACSRLLWLLSIRVKISDAARLELARDQNSIIVINHRSHLDGFALMDVVPDEKWFTFGAKKELFDSRLLRVGFEGAGLAEIDRNSGKHALESLENAVRLMPSRRSLVLFPEGTRARTESLGEFKAGVVLVARATGRAIRPIVILNSDSLLPRGKLKPKCGTVLVEVLPHFICDPNIPASEDIARLRTEMLRVFEDR